MNKERLTRLAKFLENEVPEDAFDMRQWFHQCGSPACALGWACEIPEFKAAGLDHVLRGSANYTYQVPVFSRNQGVGAAAAFFDLDEFTADALFDPGDLPGGDAEGEGYWEYEHGLPHPDEWTPADAAAAIRLVLEGKV